MGWLVGFVALLAFALPVDIRFRFGRNDMARSWTWDGPQFLASMIRHLKNL